MAETHKDSGAIWVPLFVLFVMAYGGMGLLALVIVGAITLINLAGVWAGIWSVSIGVALCWTCWWIEKEQS